MASKGNKLKCRHSSPIHPYATLTAMLSDSKLRDSLLAGVLVGVSSAKVKAIRAAMEAGTCKVRRPKEHADGSAIIEW